MHHLVPHVVYFLHECGVQCLRVHFGGNPLRFFLQLFGPFPGRFHHVVTGISQILQPEPGHPLRRVRKRGQFLYQEVLQRFQAQGAVLTQGDDGLSQLTELAFGLPPEGPLEDPFPTSSLFGVLGLGEESLGGSLGKFATRGLYQLPNGFIHGTGQTAGFEPTDGP